MKLGEAMEVLGLVGSALAELTDEQVKTAYRVTVKAIHPDVSKRALNPDMDKVGAARDALLNRRNVDDFACKTCKGTGTVRYRLGTRACVPCKGSGDSCGC